MPPSSVRLRRVYDDPSPEDGRRILVDRLWPRGLSKDSANVDLWLKEVAPSAELRAWYGHDPDRFADFRGRYLAELEDSKHRAALERLHALVREPPVTLLTATRAIGLSHAAVLAEVLNGSD